MTDRTYIKLKDTIKEQDSEIRAQRSTYFELRDTIKEQGAENRLLKRKIRRLQLEIEYYEKLAARDPQKLVVLLATSDTD